MNIPLTACFIKKIKGSDVGFYISLVLSLTRPYIKPLNNVPFNGRIVGDRHSKKVSVCLVLLALVVLLLSVISNKVYADKLERQAYYTINVPAMNAADALNLLAEQTGKTFLFPYKVAEAQQANSVVGRFTLNQALEQLLKGSALSGGLTESGVVIISQLETNYGEGIGGMNSKKKLLAATVGFFVGGGAAQVGVAADGVSGGEVEAWALEEIVVTAQKREQSLQDIPMSLTVLSGEEITAKGLVSADDYLRVLPGVNMLEQGAGRKNPIIIRGISADPQGEDPTVGLYFGEIPLTAANSSASTGTASWFGSPDIKLIDIARIEVLRGPQGTLFGAGSMGGTVRVLPTKPNTEELEGFVTAGYSRTAKEGGGNYKTTAAVNIPLIENELAIRAVAYYFDNSGYVNNVAATKGNDLIQDAAANGAAVRNKSGVGANEYKGGRMAILWQPNDIFEASLGYINQETDQDGLPEVQLSLGGYEQTRVSVSDNLKDIVRDNGLTSDVDILNLELKYDLGWAEFLSSSSKMGIDSSLARDITYARLGPADQGILADGDVLVQELRLTSSLDGAFQFMVGLYYEKNEWSNHAYNFWSGSLDANPYVSGTDFDPQFYDLQEDVEVEQNAFFAEVSYDVTEKLVVTVGGRLFEYDREQSDRQFSPAFGVDTNVPGDFDEDGDTLKFNATYNVSDDVMVYTQWAEGFRLGKPTTPLTPFCDPDGDGMLVGFNGELIDHAESLESDTLESFEIGSKLSLLDRRMTVNMAVYDIDWDGIPIGIANADATCLASQNAGKARSQGLEVETTYQMTDSFVMELGLSYVNAELVEDAGALGDDGDRLPGAPKFNGNLSLTHNFSFQGYDAYLRGDYAYVGGFYNNLQEVGVEAGDYHEFNASAGIEIGSVSVVVSGKNLTGADDLTWVNSVVSADSRAYRLRPRTLGVDVTYNF